MNPCCSLSRQLDLEWARLRRRPAAVRVANRWRLTPEPAQDLQDILVATGYRTAPTAVHNVRLHELLRRARTDDLAARIMLQRLLPGLLADVRRRAARAGAEGLFEELLPTAWIVIRVAFVAPDSQQVAATLVNDAIHRAFVAPRRKRSATEVPRDPSQFADRPDRARISPLEELAVIVREARERGLPAEDLALVRDLVAAGSPSALATQRRVTPRTIRNHRDRAVHHLRQLAAA